MQSGKVELRIIIVLDDVEVSTVPGYMTVFGGVVNDDPNMSDAEKVRQGYFLEVPDSGDHADYLGRVRGKKFVVEYPPKDKGKTAFIYIRFENDTGKKRGHWSEVYTFVIP